VPLYVGLCCTHYGFVAPRIEAALSRHAARPVVALDPNARLVDDVVSRLRDGGPADATSTADLSVEMLSKVVVPEAKREGLGRILDGISPATALALRRCTHVPWLF
jgi:glutamate racemase